MSWSPEVRVGFSPHMEAHPGFPEANAFDTTFRVNWNRLVRTHRPHDNWTKCVAQILRLHMSILKSDL